MRDTPDWLAARTITLRQALPMMTTEVAYALFRETEVGSLEAGKLADLLILSENPTTAEPERINEIGVWMTMVGGRVGQCAQGREALCPGAGTQGDT